MRRAIRRRKKKRIMIKETKIFVKRIGAVQKQNEGMYWNVETASRSIYLCRLTLDVNVSQINARHSLYSQTFLHGGVQV
jgi:hypothetical protein